MATFKKLQFFLVLIGLHVGELSFDKVSFSISFWCRDVHPDKKNYFISFYFSRVSFWIIVEKTENKKNRFSLFLPFKNWEFSFLIQFKLFSMTTFFPGNVSDACIEFFGRSKSHFLCFSFLFLLLVTFQFFQENDNLGVDLSSFWRAHTHTPSSHTHSHMHALTFTLTLSPTWFKNNNILIKSKTRTSPQSLTIMASWVRVSTDHFWVTNNYLVSVSVRSKVLPQNNSCKWHQLDLIHPGHNSNS